METTTTKIVYILIRNHNELSAILSLSLSSFHFDASSFAAIILLNCLPFAVPFVLQVSFFYSRDFLAHSLCSLSLQLPRAFILFFVMLRSQFKRTTKANEFNICKESEKTVGWVRNSHTLSWNQAYRQCKSAKEKRGMRVFESCELVSVNARSTAPMWTHLRDTKKWLKLC